MQCSSLIPVDDPKYCLVNFSPRLVENAIPLSTSFGMIEKRFLPCTEQDPTSLDFLQVTIPPVVMVDEIGEDLYGSDITTYMERAMQMGLRDANQRFSRLIKAVRGGQEVLLTERGRPLAVVRPIRTGDETESTIQRLEAAGLLRPASKRSLLPAWRPRTVHGAPLSKTVRQERDGR
jgi:prevent-host-death family protein